MEERVLVPCLHSYIVNNVNPNGLPYCPVIKRGLNFNCDFCIGRSMWKKLIEEDNGRR